MTIKSKITGFGLVFLLGVLFFAPVQAQQALQIKNARLGVHPDKTRFVLELSTAADFRVFVLPDPYRIVIDLPRAQWAAEGFRPGGGVKALHQGPLDNSTTRLELETEKPAAIGEAFSMAGPERIVIDFSPVSAAEFEAARAKTFGKLRVEAVAMRLPAAVAMPERKPEVAAVPQGLKIPATKPITRKRIIAIDAGHGGQDPGASGPGGIREKNITLTFARELKSVLEASGRYTVVLTRNSDKYLKLFQRVELARTGQADLFLSVHADSVDHGDARGASVYTLSETASDTETARLAETENRVDAISGIDLSHEEAEVASILIDLAMRETMNESKFFANILVNALKSENVRLLPNAHRSAGFAVLKAADIPSVLVELGFVSSPSEARLLNTSDHRQALARAIAAGIDSYFYRLEALHRS